MADSVIVHRSYDPVQAELLGEVLRDAGIAARVVGTRSGAHIGVGQAILHVHIEVPAAQAGAATEAIESFLTADGEALLRAEGALDDEPDEPAPTETPKRPLLAAGAALILPFGGGHFYAGRRATAAVVFVAQAAAAAVALDAIGRGDWRAMMFAIVAMPMLVVLDAIGGARALGRAAGVGRQLVAGLGWAGVALGLGGAIAFGLPERRLADPAPEAEPGVDDLPYAPGP
jgi:hypothetical protein